MLGFIGLGAMGGPMALNLRAAGYDVVVHDRRREAAAPHLERGCAWAPSVDELAALSDVVFTSLPGPPEIEAVALADRGLLAAMRPDCAWFDLSTSSPTLSSPPITSRAPSHSVSTEANFCTAAAAWPATVDSVCVCRPAAAEAASSSSQRAACRGSTAAAFSVSMPATDSTRKA